MTRTLRTGCNHYSFNTVVIQTVINRMVINRELPVCSYKTTLRGEHLWLQTGSLKDLVSAITSLLSVYKRYVYFLHSTCRILLLGQTQHLV